MNAWVFLAEALADGKPPHLGMWLLLSALTCFLIVMAAARKDRNDGGE